MKEMEEAPWCKVHMNNKKSEGGPHRTKTSFAAYGSVLLVFEVLPDGEDILAHATQVTRKDVFVRMREQINQPFDLPRELGPWRPGSGAGPSGDHPKFEGSAPVADGRAQRAVPP